MTTQDKAVTLSDKDECESTEGRHSTGYYEIPPKCFFCGKVNPRFAALEAREAQEQGAKAPKEWHDFAE